MTLTEAARLTRKLAFWGGFLIVLAIFVRISISAATGIYRQFFPQPSPAPTVTFGKLAPFDFSQNVVNTSGGVSYILQTIEEGLPNLGDQGKVFKVIQNQPSILFGEQARSQAQRLGFTQEPQIVTERLYTFSDTLQTGRKLELDVILSNFKITNDINLYPELLEMAGKLDVEDAVRVAKGFLEQNSRFQKDFSEEKITVKFLKIEGGKMVAAKSSGESQIIRVGFARSDLEKLPIVSADFEKPNVWVEVTPLADFTKRIFQASYFYSPPDLGEFASYPLKSTKVAFEELIAGGGILIGEKSPQLEIRRIYLAYLETVAPMFFFAPVYVFAGDNFLSFVPAVTSEWVGP